ncbi:MAG: hypothetical protein AAF677_14005 [Pseudomonadota bacterium]
MTAADLVDAAGALLLAVLALNVLRLAREEIADTRRRLREGRFWQRALPPPTRRRVGRYLAYGFAALAGVLALRAIG